jgi:hypothetical protein
MVKPVEIDFIFFVNVGIEIGGDLHTAVDKSPDGRIMLLGTIHQIAQP